MKTLINKKALQAKEKYYVSILLHCHYVWYVGRLNLCRVENVQLLLPKKTVASAMSLYSFRAVPGGRDSFNRFTGF